MNIQEDYVNLEMCCFRETALTLYFLIDVRTIKHETERTLESLE